MSDQTLEVSKHDGKNEEPDFMKIYLDTMMSFQGIEGVSAKLIICMCNHVEGYNNAEDSPLVFQSTKYTKQLMSSELGVSLEMVNKYIKSLSDSGILTKTGMRGVYYVNPWVLARGSWSNIKKLRVYFDLVGGKWEVNAALQPKKKK